MLEERINNLIALHRAANPENEYLKAVIHRASVENPWFSKEFIRTALEHIRDEYLAPQKLEKWVNSYDISENSKNVAIVMAGNIPLVGFHDWLCTYIAGHHAKVKLSNQDLYLFPALMKLWEEQGVLKTHTTFMEKIKDYDAVIATGSDSTIKHFEYYFSHCPGLLRGNRNSAAVLSQKDLSTDGHRLADDIFLYFGLGCRSVSKVYLHESIGVKDFIEWLKGYNNILSNRKYLNNFEYNISLYQLNKIDYYNDQRCVYKPDGSLVSRIACLHYEYYDDIANVWLDLIDLKDRLQVIATSCEDAPDILSTCPLGQTQFPILGEYADQKDTLEFLTTL